MTQSPTTGRLESIGLEEVQPGLVEDSPGNRRILRALAWYWDRILDDDGLPTGLIRPVSPEDATRRRESVYDMRRDILVDRDDKWSDYVEPDEYPLDVDIPWVILEALSKWREAERYGIPPSERPIFPRRCETMRVDGTRCWNWALDPDRMPRCKPHSGWTKKTESRVAIYAKQQILDATPEAADTLIDLSQSAAGEAVRLKATTEILDRAGVRGGTELDVSIEVQVTDPAIEVKERLSQLAERTARRAAALPSASESPSEPPSETVQGEIVE